MVGQNVPFLASTSTSDVNLNNTFNQIDRQDVGITLRLTPQISSGDFVTLNVFTEVSRVIPSAQAASLGPTTSMRTSETTVITKDGQMIVIGGLIADDVTEQDTGVPFLKDIPVLGHAFRYNSEKHSKQNLLIFITPHIVRDQFDARDASLAQRDNLERLIDGHGVYPNRKEQLHDFDLNRVTEGGVYDGEKPTTIRPPPKGGPAALQPSAPSAAAAAQDPIVMRVAPPVPQFVPQHSSLKDTAAPPRGAGQRYVVLKVDSAGASNGEGLPFTLKQGASANAAKLAGIIVPPDADAEARSFFQAGATYSYNLSSGKALFTALGVFDSADDSASFQKQLGGDWYTLSAYELLHLGREPWQKGE